MKNRLPTSLELRHLIEDMKKMLREFHSTYQEYDKVIIDEAFYGFRMKLLLEEYGELRAARTDTEVLDALCDMAYIAQGTIDLLAMLRPGIISEELWGVLTSLSPSRPASLATLRSVMEGTDYKEPSVTYLASLQEVVKECVLIAESKGYDFAGAFKEVHRSNMTKLGLDGNPIFREDGKIMKGPNYEPPQLEQFTDGRRQPTIHITADNLTEAIRNAIAQNPDEGWDALGDVVEFSRQIFKHAQRTENPKAKKPKSFKN